MNTTDGRTALITGGTKGIGFELAKMSRGETRFELATNNKINARAPSWSITPDIGGGI